MIEMAGGSFLQGNEEWNLSRIVSDYGTTSLFGSGELAQILIQSEILEQPVLATAETYERATTQQELLSMFPPGQHVAFTARPSSVFGCKFQADAWAGEASVQEGEGILRIITDAYGVIRSENLGSVFFPVRSAVDSSRMIDVEPKMSEHFRSRDKVAFRAFPQKPTNGCRWRAVEVKRLGPQTEAPKPGSSSSRTISSPKHSVIEKETKVHSADRREVDALLSQSVSQNSESFEALSLRTMTDSAIGFVVYLTHLHAYIWSVSCGLVVFDPEKAKNTEPFGALEVGTWVRFKAMAENSETPCVYPNAVELDLLDSASEKLMKSPDDLVEGIAEIVMVDTESVVMWMEKIGLVPCSRIGSLKDPRPDQPRGLLHLRYQVQLQCSINRRHPKTTGLDYIRTPWSVQRFRHSEPDPAVKFSSLIPQNASVRNVRRTSAVLMLQNIQECALLVGAQFEDAVRKNLLTPRNSFTVIALPIPMQKPYSFQYRCTEILRVLGAPSGGIQNHWKPSADRDPSILTTGPAKEESQERRKVSDVDLLTGSPMESTQVLGLVVPDAPSFSSPSLNQTENRPDNITDDDDVNGPLSYVFPAETSMDVAPGETGSSMIPAQSMFAEFAPEEEESVKRSRSASREEVSSKFRQRSLSRPNSVASRLRDIAGSENRCSPEPRIVAGQDGSTAEVSCAVNGASGGSGDAVGRMTVSDALSDMARKVTEALIKDLDLFHLFTEKEPELMKEILILKGKHVL